MLCFQGGQTLDYHNIYLTKDTGVNHVGVVSLGEMDLNMTQDATYSGALVWQVNHDWVFFFRDKHIRRQVILMCREQLGKGHHTQCLARRSCLCSSAA